MGVYNTFFILILVIFICISLFYKSRGTEFRKDYSRLQEILSSFPGVPSLVLTATASPAAQNSIVDALLLDKPKIITVNPDRPNIFYEIQERKPSTQQVDELEEIVLSMAKDLSLKKEAYPLTIMYTTLENIRISYEVCDELLGEMQYCGEPEPETRLFQQFHADITDDMKNVVIRDLAKPNPTARLIFATIALGMGLDAPSIERVIHFVPPTSLDKYVQETGRAGRNGQDATALLYFNNTDLRSNRPGISKSIINYCKSNRCLRQTILEYLGFTVDPCRQLCKCCSHCKPQCKCDFCSNAL